ncbi:MAG: prolyl oligopeptidase family serine peptidase [Phycisphaerales bacterium]|nr:prolyl oligopeptidase family serine peptidase [Phycisphaerales bacterium]
MFSLSLVVVLVTSLAAVPDIIEPSGALAIESTGSRWRRPVHTDAVQHAIVTGTWTAPAAGDTVEHDDGSTLTWTPLEPDDKGRVTGPRGGYVFYAFESDEAYPALLDIRGHSLAYVNGEPRGGDVYNRGTLRLPFMVQNGRNELLFRSGRGPLKPIVRSATAVAEMEMSNPGDTVAFIGTQDQTLPDLVTGEPIDVMAAMLIYNVSPDPLDGLWLDASVQGFTTATKLDTLQPMSFLKVPFRISCSMDAPSQDVPVRLRLRDGSSVLDVEEITLSVKTPSDLHHRTFQSDIDGSVQYYAVRPAVPGEDAEDLPGLALSLHGASVEARGQAACYRPREWVHVVAPTNRRPFGFDWEHWGRRDAMEVLTDAAERYPSDPARRWLTGHSMGGHGTWQLGATFPDQWAAIAPSAGWISFWTYGGPERYARDGGIEEILHRAANPSDTLLMKDNLDQFGIYVLHGDADNNVPVDQARQMREVLGGYHPDWTYYERPGAGHWWGNQCMDWPPLFSFLQERERPDPATIDRIDFTTVDPRASATNHWVTIESQEVCLEPSRVDLARQRDKGTITGTTENVSRLSVGLSHFPAETDLFQLEIDGTTLESDRPADHDALHIAKRDGSWVVTGPASADLKGPHRAGPFRDAFNNNVLLVYGTRGTKAETARNRARARLDAERFWYRGNGYLPFVPDTEFEPSAEPDRNVVLYGNADTHAHWNTLVPDSPLILERGGLRLDGQVITGDDLATVFIRPRPGSDLASVGVVGGSGLPGDRLTEQMPFFFAGVGWPDWMILAPESLRQGPSGVVGTGFFAEDWSFDPRQSALGDRAR